jgi:hypothetical protein
MHEDNFSPNIGLVEDYPLRVVFFAPASANKLYGFAAILRDAMLRIAPQDEGVLFFNAYTLILRRPEGPSRRIATSASNTQR